MEEDFTLMAIEEMKEEYMVSKVKKHGVQTGINCHQVSI